MMSRLSVVMVAAAILALPPQFSERARSKGSVQGSFELEERTIASMQEAMDRWEAL